MNKKISFLAASLAVALMLAVTGTADANTPRTSAQYRVSSQRALPVTSQRRIRVLPRAWQRPIRQATVQRANANSQSSSPYAGVPIHHQLVDVMLYGSYPID